ncbi:MAG TPA: hypothetical protein VN783_06055 [Thermoanaerobaculia bacterium]|nr:hypothetical protein [Thermoanaerobaculia bacterium]
MVYSRQPGRFTLPGFGGPSGPPPRDVLALLAVVFATFTLQFFASTAIVPALLRLSSDVWRRGFVWQLATYPFIGSGAPSFFFLLDLLVLFWFGRDVYLDLGRRRFWRLLLSAALVAGLVALAVDALVVLLGWPDPAPFALMQGQWMLLAILIAAFAMLHGEATIYLFFVLPVRARWFIGIEILIAFLGFLSVRDLAGFAGIVSAIGFVWFRSTFGQGRGALRRLRLRFEKRVLEWKLGRLRRKRGLKVLPGGGDPRKGPWTN